MDSKITRIELPEEFGMTTVNCYLVEGEKISLVDCGEDTDASFDALSEGLSAQNLSFKDIDDIYITHAHVDHIGMADRVSKAADCSVWVSDLVKPWATNLEYNWKKRADIMVNTMGEYLPKELSHGLLMMFKDMSNKILQQWEDIDPDRLNIFNHGEGQVNIGGEPWEVIHAPGHTSTQSCFYHRPTQRLLAADMLLNITPTPVMEPLNDNQDVRERGILTLLQSYEYFRNLDITTVYPGHYQEFDDPKVKIDRQVKRIHQRKEECYELIASGTDNLLEIFQELYKGRWHMPAFNMTLAYIDLLLDEGRIEEVEDPSGIKIFHPIKS